MVGCASVSKPPAATTVVAIVSGHQHEPVPGAGLSLKDSTGAERELTTDQNGRGTFTDLPHGTYQVLVSHPSYQTEHERIDVIGHGQLMHIRLRSLRSVENEVAALIRAGRYEDARALAAESAPSTEVLQFLDLVAAYYAGDYREVVTALSRLELRFPDLTLLQHIRAHMQAGPENHTGRHEVPAAGRDDPAPSRHEAREDNP
jgi:hypothetical protein